MNFRLKLSPFAFTLLVAILLLPCIIGFFYTVTMLEQREQHRSLQNRAQTQFQKVQSSFVEITSLLQTLRSLFELNPQLSRAEFDYVVSSQPIADYGISAFEWIPKIPVPQLRNWVKDVRSSGQFNFKSNYNYLYQDKRIPDAFPIKYSSSSQMAGFSLGKNLAQDYRYAPLLLKAQQSPSIQLEINLRPDTDKLPISRIVLATYQNDDFSYSSLIGYVAASFNLEETLNVLLGNSLSNLNLCLVVNQQQELLIADKALNIFQNCQSIPHTRSWQVNYNFAGKQLLFTFFNSDHNLNSKYYSAAHLATFAFFIAALCSLFYLYTSRKYALEVECLIKRKQERFEDLSENYSKLFMLSVDGIYKANIEGQLLQANPAFASAFNYESEQDICHHRQSISSLLHVSEASYQLFIEKLQTEGQVSNFEWLGLSRDNQPVWVVENAYLIKGDSDNVCYQGFISIITERKNAELKLQYQAQYDSLTGLRNRISFVNFLDSQMIDNNSGQLAVLFVDIDRFKSINDNFGHTTGDEVLVEFSQRLASCFDQGQVARFGGDEFAILLNNVSNTAHLQALCQQIISKLQPSFKVSGRNNFKVTASIGASLITSQCGNATQALQQADLAMYSVKQKGKNNLAIYDKKLSEQLQRRLTLELLLKDALLNQEFYIVYQPVMDLQRLTVVGFEALIRWKSPELGLISPVDFIPVLEELNIIDAVGEWIIRQTCAQISEFISISQNPSLFININVSPKQLICGDIALLLEQQLQIPYLKSNNIHIEITETQIYSNEDALMRQLNKINALGIGIFIDDFGTGHSSLERLVNYPLQGIKLDRSFVSGLTLNSNNAIVLEATVRMADLLGLEVTVEGIETKHQQEFFNVLGCRFAQGYLFHPPLEVQQVLHLIENTLLKNQT